MWGTERKAGFVVKTLERQDSSLLTSACTVWVATFKVSVCAPSTAITDPANALILKSADRTSRSPSVTAGIDKVQYLIPHPIGYVIPDAWNKLICMVCTAFSPNYPAAVSVPKITASSFAFCACAIIIKTNSNLQTAVVGAHQFYGGEWTNAFSKLFLLQPTWFRICLGFNLVAVETAMTSELGVVTSSSE